MKILSFAATNSNKSINKQLVQYASGKIESANIDYVDLNDFDLPIYSIDLEEKFGIPNVAHTFQERIQQADAVLISLAEHNGSYTAAFKNLFDWLSRIDRNVYGNKPVLLLATSPGESGASTVLTQAIDAVPYKDQTLKCPTVVILRKTTNKERYRKGIDAIPFFPASHT